MKREVILTSKTSRFDRNITLTIEGGIITTVENTAGVPFPFVVGQPFHRNVETWAENHGFLFNGVDTEKRDRKVMGIRISDVPQGHPLRYIYPGKFR